MLSLSRKNAGGKQHDHAALSIGRSMRPDLRRATSLPLTELWTDEGPISAHRLHDLDRSELTEMLRAGCVLFVVADVGQRLTWIPEEACFVFWKTEVKPHLADPTERLYLADWPEEYYYLASLWELGDGRNVVVLTKHH
jgi:hypothetical protein